MAEEIVYNVNDATREIVVTFNVRGIHVLKMRLWIAKHIFQLACWVAGCQGEIED